MKTLVIIMSLLFIAEGFAAKVKTNIKASIVCGTCKGIIERGLKGKKGIISVKADVTSKKVKIMYEDTQVSLAEIEQMIVDLGYSANGKPANPEAFKKLPHCCKEESATHHE
jgi:mercuric ion binding protein